MGLAIRDLTVKERILLHLFDHQQFGEEYEVPLAITQTGIAEAAGFRVQHATQYLRPLRDEGLVEEDVRHIRRQPRRRKVYFLTHAGKLEAAALRSALFRETVPYRRRSGKVEELPLAQVYQEERRGARILELLGELADAGAVSDAVEAVPGLVDFAQEAPAADLFYGREAELRTVLEGLQEAPVVVVTGMAGIGKSTLGAKVCETLRGAESLFWREVRPWDTAADLALRLGLFLRALGRPDLHDYLSAGGAMDLNRVEDLLAGDLAGVQGLLVFDDVHEAGPEALNLLSVLHRALQRQEGGARMLVLSRVVPRFYGVREAELEGSVREISLGGLDAEPSRRFLEDQGVSATVAPSLIATSGGSPLFLKLLARSTVGDEGRGAGSLEAYIAEEIEPSLDEGEREALQLASLYEVPVAPEALLLGAAAAARTLVSLERKNLLDRRGGQQLSLHASLRGYFRRSLPSDRRSALASRAAGWLLRKAEALAKEGRPFDAVALVENALAVEPDEERYLAAHGRLADLRRSVGDWDGAVEDYRAILHRTEDPRSQAMVHMRLSACLRQMWRLEDAEREARRGLALLPSDSSPESALLLLELSHVTAWSGRYEEAEETTTRVEGWLDELPEDPGLRRASAEILAGMYYINPLRRDFAVALQHARDAIELFEAGGFEQPWFFQSYGVGAIAAFHLGRIDEALSLLDRGWEVTERVGPLTELGNILSVKAFILAEARGAFGEAEALLTDALQWTKRTRQEVRIAWYPRLFANLYHRQGRWGEARESLAYFLDGGGDVLRPEDLLEGHAHLARVCQQLGDDDAAVEHLSRAEEFPQGSGDELGWRVLWARGVVNAHQGKAKEARRDFEEALRAEIPPFRGVLYQVMMATTAHRGEILLDYGRLLARMGEGEAAREILRQALQEAKDLDRRPLAKAAEEALAPL